MFSFNSIILTVVGVLWSIVGYFIKKEIENTRKDFTALRVTLEVLIKEFYTLQGEHIAKRCEQH